MVLPLYKMIERHLQTAIDDEDLHQEPFLGLKSGLKAGLKKTKKHLDKALEGDYPLLGAGMCLMSSTMLSILNNLLFHPVLHPSIRLAYFQNSAAWGATLATRARTLLEHLYDTYRDDNIHSQPMMLRYDS
jgi:hypothetical protein